MGYEGWIKIFTHKIGKMNFKNQGKSGGKVPCILTSISKPAFWFLLVSEPQKPIKTNKNQETRKFENPGPISQKPHMSTYSKKPKKPTETTPLPMTNNNVFLY